MWAERSTADCCVVVWQISVAVESFNTEQQVWVITLWGGGKMGRGWWELYVTDDLG